MEEVIGFHKDGRKSIGKVSGESFLYGNYSATKKQWCWSLSDLAAKESIIRSGNLKKVAPEPYIEFVFCVDGLDMVGRTDNSKENEGKVVRLGYHGMGNAVQKFDIESVEWFDEILNF